MLDNAELCCYSVVARYQILGGHTVNRGVGYGVHNYINLKILGGHVPVCPPYEYGPEYVSKQNDIECKIAMYTSNIYQTDRKKTSLVAARQKSF